MVTGNELDCKKLAAEVASLVTKSLDGQLAALILKTDKLMEEGAKRESRINMIEHEQRTVDEIKNSINGLKKSTDEMNLRLTLVEKNTDELVGLKNSIIRWIIGAFAVLIIALAALATAIPKLLGG